jgi:hypothetical protein
VKTRIEKELTPLMSLELSKVSRGANMLMFTFGPLRSIPDTHRGGERQVGDFALNVQCAWRIRDTARILIGFTDIFYPADLAPSEPVPQDFDWDVAGVNRCDRFFESFVSSHPVSSLRVISVGADDFGGFTLSFSGGFALDVFPHNGSPDEVWRRLSPGTDREHFVMPQSLLEAQPTA